MNPSAIINDDMTLDEKLAAIDQTMKELQEEANEKAETDGVEPIDPATLTMCEGCQ
mgnify:CR=1 FL=1